MILKGHASGVEYLRSEATLRIKIPPQPLFADPIRRLCSVCLITSALMATSPLLGQESLGSIVVQSGEGTEVPVAAQLTGILESGGIPSSIDQLWELERQQQLVAQAAVKCTVSVKIGPAQGCGVIITDNGYVLTAAHVAMRPGKKAIITLPNGREVSATTLGMNRNVDAGLIRIDPGQNDGQPWPHASLGTSKNLVEGMWCVATGHPGGFDQRRGPVTRVGRISLVRDSAINTDCALIGGDSGGPLFDIAGKLIAIHSRIGNDVADNLHVPIDNYNEHWDRLRDGESWGSLPGFRPVLGVKGSKSAPQAIVDVVSPNSPAEAGGIQPGDIIDQFGEKPITDFESLKKAVADTMPGERVNIWVTRGGTVMRLTVEVGRAD